VPRVDGGGAAADGVRVAGTYAELRLQERDDCGFPEPNKVLSADGKGFYMRPRGLMEALESGVPVVVCGRTAEMAHAGRYRLPRDRSIQSVLVTPTDSVSPTTLPHPWYGCAADDASRFSATKTSCAATTVMCAASTPTDL
jgi:hypothetical protein